jgi:bacterioferritin-associated ferredoxin
MYVCICNAVTEKDIAIAVDRGVRTMRQLRMATQCSSQCGSCAELAKATMAEAITANSSINRQLFSVAITAV